VIGEFENEPIRGLPERLPPGEEILWQGSPTRRASILRSFRAGAVALYFVALAAIRLAFALSSGASAYAVAASTALVLVVGLAAVALLALLGVLVARSTVYTITNRRVVMRFGMALPMAINLPFGMIRGAAMKEYADGTGDLPLELGPDSKFSYLVLWPHARPWVFSHPQPMLRGVPDPQHITSILAAALRAAHPANDAAVAEESAASVRVQAAQNGVAPSGQTVAA
jgi:hypothetical protein